MLKRLRDWSLSVIAIVASLCVIGSFPLRADTVPGYVVLASYGWSLPEDTFGDGGGYQQNLTTTNGQTTYALASSAAFNTIASTSYQAFDLTNGTLYPVSASMGIQDLSAQGPQLHTNSFASVVMGDPNVSSSASLDTTLIWLDNISFYGAPVGTPVQVKLTEVFDGSLTGSGGFVPGGGVYLDTSIGGGDVLLQDLVSNSTNPFRQSVSMMFNSAVGQTLALNEDLAVGFGGDDGFGVTVAASDTANVYLSVLTPGVSIASASGYSYAAPAITNVPEPSLGALTALFVLGISVWRGTQKRKADLL